MQGQPASQPGMQACGQVGKQVGRWASLQTGKPKGKTKQLPGAMEEGVIRYERLKQMTTNLGRAGTKGAGQIH